MDFDKMRKRIEELLSVAKMGVSSFNEIAVDLNTIIVLIVAAIFIHMNMEEVKVFYKSAGINITPWLFPFVMSTRIVRTVLYFGYIVIISGYIENLKEKYFFIIRCGRLRFHMSRLCGITLISMGYFGVILLMSILFNIGNMEWSVEWGKVLGTLAYTDAGKGFDNSFVFNATIVEEYMPITAMLLSYILSSLSGIFIGCLIYAISLFDRHLLGMFIPGLLIILDFFVETLIYFRREGGILISPLTWNDIKYITTMKESMYPSLSYVFWGYVILITILIIFIVKVQKRVDL